jgi:hypothetical protein
MSIKLLFIISADLVCFEFLYVSHKELWNGKVLLKLNLTSLREKILDEWIFLRKTDISKELKKFTQLYFHPNMDKLSTLISISTRQYIKCFPVKNVKCNDKLFMSLIAPHHEGIYGALD